MHSMNEDSRKSYPAVHLLVDHGGLLAILIALLVPIAAVWFWFSGYGVPVLVAGIISGLLVYLLMRSYVELVRIMADMLLPKE
jgi:hypothetical protein